MNILLVEDNDIDVLMFQRALKKAGTGSRVVRARDGVEALEILTAKNPDSTLNRPFVILLDINMPRMNGHDFLTELRANKDICGARVVVVTTSDDPKDIQRAYDRCASGYVLKPQGAVAMSEVILSLHEFWGICEDTPLEPTSE